MGFVLKVYLIGLMAFVPSQKGTQMTVLLVDGRDGYHASDGTSFPPHHPILLARAGRCEGDCQQDIEKVAPQVFCKTCSDTELRYSADPVARLKQSIQRGGVWAISADQISVQPPTASEVRARTRGELVVLRDRRASEQVRGSKETPKPLPARQSEKEDFSWVAEMERAVPGTGQVDPDCLAPKPVKGLVAGRLVLDQGTLKTYKLAEFYPPKERGGGGGIPKMEFLPLAAGANARPGEPPYTQALADWTVVEIPIEGCEVTLIARAFDGSRQRTMKLSPASCNGNELVEVTLLNLPDPALGSAEHAHGSPRGEGTHFELFYELSKNRPAWRQRAVPQVTTDYIPPATIGQDEEASKFLTSLGIPRAGMYSRPICPQTVFEEGS